MGTDTMRQGRLVQRIKESNGFRPRPLVYAVVASIACTMITPVFGTGRLGALGAAVLGPVLTAVFTTHGPPRIRIAAMAVITVIAVAVTVTGFTIPEVVRGGDSLIANRPGTFMETAEYAVGEPSP